MLTAERFKSFSYEDTFNLALPAMDMLPPISEEYGRETSPPPPSIIWSEGSYASLRAEKDRGEDKVKQQKSPFHIPKIVVECKENKLMLKPNERKTESLPLLCDTQTLPLICQTKPAGARGKKFSRQNWFLNGASDESDDLDSLYSYNSTSRPCLTADIRHCRKGKVFKGLSYRYGLSSIPFLKRHGKNVSTVWKRPYHRDGHDIGAAPEYSRITNAFLSCPIKNKFNPLSGSLTSNLRHHMSQTTTRTPSNMFDFVLRYGARATHNKPHMYCFDVMTTKPKEGRSQAGKGNTKIPVAEGVDLSELFSALTGSAFTAKASGRVTDTSTSYPKATEREEFENREEHQVQVSETNDLETNHTTSNQENCEVGNPLTRGRSEQNENFPHSDTNESCQRDDVMTLLNKISADDPSGDEKQKTEGNNENEIFIKRWAELKEMLENKPEIKDEGGIGESNITTDSERSLRQDNLQITSECSARESSQTSANVFFSDNPREYENKLPDNFSTVPKRNGITRTRHGWNGKEKLGVKEKPKKKTGNLTGRDTNTTRGKKSKSSKSVTGTPREVDQETFSEESYNESSEEMRFSFGSELILPPSKFEIEIAETRDKKPKAVREIIRELKQAEKNFKKHAMRLALDVHEKDEDDIDDDDDKESGRTSACLEISDNERQTEEAETQFFNRIKARVLRMRKVLPPPAPTKLCFVSRGGSISHKEVKSEIEKSGKVKVTSLQYDPVYLNYNSGEEVYKSVWIFEISLDSDRKYLLINNIMVNGRSVTVRPLDDVYMEEHRTYQLYHAIRVEQRQKRLIKFKKYVSKSHRRNRH